MDDEDGGDVLVVLVARRLVGGDQGGDLVTQSVLHVYGPAA